LVQVSDGLVKILKIKVEGKKEQSGRDFINGLQGKKTVFI